MLVRSDPFRQFDRLAEQVGVGQHHSPELAVQYWDGAGRVHDRSYTETGWRSPAVVEMT
jgi:hypothetical protein